MTERTVRLLEFNQVVSRVAGFCRSPQGAERITEAPVESSAAAVDALHDAVAEARTVLARSEEKPNLSFPEIRSAFGPLEKSGTVLEAEELADIGTHLRSAETLARYLRKHLESEDSLYEIADAMPQLKELLRGIEYYLEPNGEVKEVPELKEIRSRIKAATQKVTRVAESYIRSSDMQGYWTSDTAPQRDGRVVLPLHANHRGRVRGVVHEVSATGTTVYVEPADLMEANNALRSAHDEYRQEVHRILQKLTERARSHRDSLSQIVEGVAYIDGMLARAQFADKLHCARPEWRGREIRVTQARHPLLGEGVVPIDIVFPEGTTTLVITGPNTGGKTVALKTLGLLVLMNQSGIPIPADEATKLPLFRSVFADIGDEQSIAQSLSTFSGHMTTIAQYLRQASSDALVLLDELGAGTDPEEGSALAMAILDKLREAGATSFITTHHSALKGYAYSHEEVENASVEFDTETLRPTYRLLTGVPGSSHALTIAERTGVPTEVVELAERYMKEHHSDSAQLIRRLTEQESAVRVEQQRLSEERERAQRRSEEAEERKRSLDERERTLREEGIRRLEQFTADARKRLENLIRELREGDLSKTETKRAKEFVRELESVAKRESDALREERESDRARSAEGGVTGRRDEDIRRAEEAELGPGVTVKLRGPGTRGVLRRRAKGNKWVVQTDSLTVTVPESELVVVGQNSRSDNATGKEPAYSYSVAGHTGGVAQEIDLRGMREADAEETLRRHLDDAILANMETIGIIHGKGEGVLQTGVRLFLEDHPSVERYEYALPEQGGFGKTIAYLKRE